MNKVKNMKTFEIVPLAFIIVSGAFITSLLMANIFGSLMFDAFGKRFSLGVFALPFCFFLTDIISEVYGKKNAEKVVFVGIIMQLLLLGFVLLGHILPLSKTHNVAQEFFAMYTVSPRMILASMLSYCASQTLDLHIFHKISQLTAGKHLWLRNNVSTAISQLVDNSIFMFVYFYGSMSFERIIGIMFSLYIAKMIVNLVDTPFIYLARAVMMRKNSKYKSI